MPHFVGDYVVNRWDGIKVKSTFIVPADSEEEAEQKALAYVAGHHEQDHDKKKVELIGVRWIGG